MIRQLKLCFGIHKFNSTTITFLAVKLLMNIFRMNVTATPLEISLIVEAALFRPSQVDHE